MFPKHVRICVTFDAFCLSRQTEPNHSIKLQVTADHCRHDQQRHRQKTELERQHYAECLVVHQPQSDREYRNQRSSQQPAREIGLFVHRWEQIRKDEDHSQRYRREYSIQAERQCRLPEIDRQKEQYERRINRKSLVRQRSLHGKCSQKV